jgi:hypothetical protein
MRIIGLIIALSLAPAAAWAQCSSSNLSACPSPPFNSVTAATLAGNASASTVTGNGVTNTLGTWTGYLAGSANPTPLLFRGTSTSALTGDKAQVSSWLNNPSLTANSVLQGALGCASAGVLCSTADAVRGIATATPGSTILGVNGVAAYVVNEQVSTGNGQNTVGFFGIAESAVNNAKTWGINTVLIDNTTQTLSSGTGRAVLNEFDYNITSPNTSVTGLIVNMDGPAQSTNAIGMAVNSVQSGIQWSASFESNDNATQTAFLVGTTGPITSANQNSQQIVFTSTNGSATPVFDTVQLIANEGLSLGGNVVIPPGSGITTGTNGLLATDSSADVFIGSGSGIPTITIGNSTASIAMEGPVLLTPKTVATLPACASGLKGALVEVTDATSPTYNGTLTGGGSVAIPVFCNGTAWTAH